MGTTSVSPGMRVRDCAAVFLVAALAGSASLAYAQEQEQEGGLEEVVVTAQRHAENAQDVPISLSALDGNQLAAMMEGGDDIRALATRVPSLYAESSNGRLAPRFYIRGLGNSDFDLAASQPVSVIVDDVVLENVILKSFPLFDIDRVEVLRGPQGSLFGRNTTAGIVKFDTKKPTHDLDGDLNLTYGELGSKSVQAAIGGGLSDTISARVSVLYHDRDDWIDNGFTGEKNAMGGFHEYAYRGQLLIEPSDNFSALLNIHGRDIKGTASIFRANVLGPGSDGFNSNFDRGTVFYDGGSNNPQSAKGHGASLKLDFKVGGNATLTSVSAYETTNSSSLGDIDGGFGAGDPTTAGPCPPGSGPGDRCIPFPSESQDGIDDLDQYTQEIRIASQATDQTFWQAGVFYFDSKFNVTTLPFFVPPTTLRHKNTAWAVFGHVSYDVSDALTVTGGVRYTDDKKDLDVIDKPVFFNPPLHTDVSDSQVSGDLSLLYKVNDRFNVYGRLARGFRAPTIQGRDIAFLSPSAPSVAKSETINSIEAGFKSELADKRIRINGAVYYYQVNDLQLTAIGGGGNFVQLINADKGTGLGFDLDGEFLLTDRFLMTLGLSYSDTKIKDKNLTVLPCGAALPTATFPGPGFCTFTDPMNANFTVNVDGNPFPQAPKYIATVTARYGLPMPNNSEIFFATDWAFQGETQFFIYESAEFKSDSTFEGGARVGYSHDGGKWELALFGRNITDEENVKGGIDFNNFTGFDNEPRIIGVSFTTRIR